MNCPKHEAAQLRQLTSLWDTRTRRVTPELWTPTQQDVGVNIFLPNIKH